MKSFTPLLYLLTSKNYYFIKQFVRSRNSKDQTHYGGDIKSLFFLINSVYNDLLVT